MNSRSAQTGKRMATGWVVALTAIGSLLAGAIVALVLPGRRRTAESVHVGAVPALEGAGRG
jgi:hypothetical protein